MTYIIDIQNALNKTISITDQEITDWASLALENKYTSAELTIRLVELDEMIYLNNTYRAQNKPTNVLSFPSNLPKHINLDYPLLGDIIICPDVLSEESTAKNITLTAHWAHIVIHGVLHLLGYDHIYDDDAIIMQAIEIQLLDKLGFNNPYQEDDLLE